MALSGKESDVRACQARGQGLQPPDKFVETGSHSLDAQLGVVGTLALGRRLVARFGQIVGEGQSGHDDETLVADLAERLAHFADFFVNTAGKRFEPRFLALVASKTVF